MFDMDAAYREYAVMVYKFLLSLCYEEELAEELTQETFYQAVRSVDRYDGSCKVSTWLCQIAKHLWYREMERRKRKGTSELTADMESLEKACNCCCDECGNARNFNGCNPDRLGCWKRNFGKQDTGSCNSRPK